MARALTALAREARDTVRLLRSRGVVVGAMVALLVLYVLGLVVPQRVSMSPAAWAAWREQSPRVVGFLEVTGLQDVYLSPPMFAALGIFFAALLAVLWERVPRAFRATRLSYGVPIDGDALARRRGSAVVEGAGDAALDRAAAVLAERGYGVMRAPSGLRAVRFRLAPLGFLAFHGSFGLLLAGGILLDLTRFSATVSVAEGEAFDAARGPYLSAPRRPRVGAGYPSLAFTVLDVRPIERDGAPLQLEVEALVAGELQPETFRVNEPLVRGSTSVLAVDAAPAPLLACEVNGVERDGAWVKLLRTVGDPTRYLFDACELEVLARPAGDVEAAAAAAAAEKDAKPGQMIRRNPATRRSGLPDGLEVAIRGPDGEVTRGVLRPGGAVATADGKRRLLMHEVRRYAALQIVDERGGGLLWAGFVAGIVGLIARLVLYRREVVVARAADGRIAIASAQDVTGLWSQARVLADVEGAVRSGTAAPPEAAARG